jgi:hypothetical protein
MQKEARTMRRKEASAPGPFLAGSGAGMMTAGAVWWLLLPSLEWASAGAVPAFLPAALGFWLGYGLGRGCACRLGAGAVACVLICLVPGAAPWIGSFWAGVVLREVVAGRLAAISSPADAGGFALGFTLVMALAVLRGG